MKTIFRSIIVTLFVTLSSVPVLAATGSRQDHSSLVVWGFLGFCALIVIAQLLPAIRSARQAAKVSSAQRAQIDRQ